MKPILLGAHKRFRILKRSSGHSYLLIFAILSAGKGGHRRRRAHTGTAGPSYTGLDAP